MSRRAPADNRVEQNRATLKSLVKLESNKSCADCKKNKHPRWASWNLGIFVCIRCSGIHRGMGTHISRVKSVDLDSWTDEQTQSMLKWGNSRANKYWEAKLAEGHVPSEAKIENFIRTKYESKRWVMEGPMPDPSTLDGDDLATAPAQTAAAVERSSSQRQPVTRQAPRATLDLFGDEITAPARPSTGPPTGTQPPPKANAAPPRQSKPAESLLGLDFFGSAPAPARPSSELGSLNKTTGPSKADLKQSILSLYASAPKPPPQQTQPSAFSSLSSPSQSPPPQQQSSGFGGLDAFSSLNMGSSSAAPSQSKASAFSDLASLSSPKASSSIAPSIGAGGSFFDAGPKSPPATQKTTTHKPSSSGGFGDLFSAPSPPSQPKPQSSSLSADLFDFSSPAPAPAQPSSLASQSITLSSNSSKPAPSNAPSLSSAFNLSSTTRQTQSSQAAPPPVSSGFSGMDAWGSSDVWGAPESAPAPSAPPGISNINSMDSGWGSSTKSTKPTETTIAGDEDFGGWNSAPTIQAPTSTSSSTTKPSGGGFNGNNDDLFGNVWN